MKFLCERDALKEGMAAIIGRTKHGKAIPILGHVLIEAEGQALRLTGNDCEACSVMEIPAEVYRPGSYTVPADRLNKLVAGLPQGGQITFDMPDDGFAPKVRSGRSNYSFAGLPAADFPVAFEVKDPIEFSLTAGQVRRLFKVPAPAITKEEARVYFRGIFLHHEKGRLIAVASDGHTLIRTMVSTDVPKFMGVIVPEAACDEIARLTTDGGVVVSLSGSLIQVRCGKRRFVSKLIDATFPEYQTVIPQSNPPAFKFDVKAMHAAIARMEAVGDGKQKAVRVAWDASAQTLTLQRRGDSGEASEEIDCDCTGRSAPGETAFNIDYISRLIEASGGDVAQFLIDGPGDPARIMNPDDPDFTSVIMPMRY